jgi:hypothetical protein
MKKLFSVSVTIAVLWFSLVFMCAPAQATVIQNAAALSGIGTSSANLHALKVRGEIAII